MDTCNSSVLPCLTITEWCLVPLLCSISDGGQAVFDPGVPARRRPFHTLVQRGESCRAECTRGAPTFPTRQRHKRRGISVTLMYAVQCHVNRESWSWRGWALHLNVCVMGLLGVIFEHRMICERLGSYWRVKFVFSVAAVGVVNLAGETSVGVGGG